MPIRNNIVGQECVDEYEASAKSRIEAGFKLLAESDAIGVSLMGEAVEMLLKASYFSFVKSANTDPITFTDLDNARQAAQRLGVTEPHERYHNPRFWAELLIAIRASPSIRAPLSTSTEAAVRHAAARLALNWNIADRYRNVQNFAAPQDLQDVFDDAMAIWKLYPGLRK